MAIKITDECINCGTCEIKCSNKAIYEGVKEWAFSYGIPEYQFKKNVRNALDFMMNLSELLFAR